MTTDDTTQATEATEADYWAASDWAETVVIDPDAPGVLRGEEAAAYGRSLMAGARVGRPSLDPSAEPGEQARIRHVRLDTALDQQLDQRVRDLKAHGTTTTASQLMRDALAEYLSSAPAL